jgi:hypothetical protein
VLLRHHGLNQVRGVGGRRVAGVDAHNCQVQGPNGLASYAPTFDRRRREPTGLRPFALWHLTFGIQSRYITRRTALMTSCFCGIMA